LGKTGRHDAAGRGCPSRESTPPEHPLAIAELERGWGRRAEQNEYLANAGSQLLGASHQIRDRELANAGKPVEKLIFTETGPLKVLVDGETGKQMRTDSKGELP
jgi:hypothetical protein